VSVHMCALCLCLAVDVESKLHVLLEVCANARLHSIQFHS